MGCRGRVYKNSTRHIDVTRAIYSPPRRSCARVRAQMGGFYELSPEEADALNANDGCEPLTFEKYKPHRKQGDEGATFRLYWDSQVSRCPPGHQSAEEQLGAQDAAKYAVYDAHALWNWLKAHERDPTNTFKVDREDWMLLREAFDATMAIPDFVQRLPHHSWPDFGPNTTWMRKAATTDYPDGTIGPTHCWSAYVDGSERFRTFTCMHKIKSASDGFYMEGPKGAERIVRVERNGSTSHCSGPSREERCYQIDRPDGGAAFFNVDEGVRTRRAKHKRRPFWSHENRGRLYKSTNRERTITKHFEGPKDHERLTKFESTDPSSRIFVSIHFTGKRGKERVTRVIRHQSQGGVSDTLYKKGPKGRECIWKRVIQNKWSIYYEGERHKEAVRKVVKHEGPCVVHCDGPRLGEWIVKCEVQNQQGFTRAVSMTARRSMIGSAWGAHSLVIPPPAQA